MSRAWYQSWSTAAWLFGLVVATTSWLTISDPMALVQPFIARILAP